MHFDHSPQTQELIGRLDQFFAEEIDPVEEPMLRELLAKDFGDRWVVPPVVEELKAKARGLGLWNLFPAGCRARCWPEQCRLRPAR